MRIFGGIEGGSTKTYIALISSYGEVLAESATSCTNPWLLGQGKEDGFVVAAKKLNDLVIDAWNKLENKEDCELISVGMCLSGAGSSVAHKRLNECFSQLNVAYHIYIANDSLAPIYTAFKNGGIVIISGTGSNCVLVNPINNPKTDTISTHSAGGWGYLLGDEGSAYWIAQRAIKYVVDVNDNFIVPEGDIDYIKDIVFKHFNITTVSDILPYFYSNFKKDFIASLTAKLALAANEIPIVKNIFEEAGATLAHHLLAVYPNVDKRLVNVENGLPVVCTGSVFKSWHLLKPGFVKCLENSNLIKEVNLCTITTDSTIGSAFMAARLSDYDLQIDLKNYVSQLDHLKI